MGLKRIALKRMGLEIIGLERIGLERFGQDWKGLGWGGLAGIAKGPVSGFVGHIPHPSLDNTIIRNHQMGPNLTFLFGFGLT